MTGLSEFGSKGLMRRYFDFYSDQLGLLEKLYQRQFYELDNVRGSRIDSLYPLLFSLHEIGKSISILFCYGQLNECFMLARSLLERLISYLYLLFCEETEYLNYLAYTKQKAVRVLKRSITVGDLTAKLEWSGSIDLNKELELKKAVELYTSKKGRQITRWTTSNLEEMLKIISEKGNIQIGFLMLAILAIYDDASEALHGTLYGSIFHIGVFTSGVPSTKDELERRFNEQFSMLFYGLGACIHTLMKGIHKVYPIEDILSMSTRNLEGTKGWLANK